MPPAPREWTLGNQTLRFEPPDVFWARFHGVLTLEEATQAVSIYREMFELRPFIFVAEVRGLNRMDAEAGRYLSEHLPTEWFLGNIYIGARLLHRALAKGLALASLLSPYRDERAVDKIHHVSTPEQAHALIARLRARHRGA